MHEGHRSRMKERVMKNGVEALEDHELLEMLLYAYIPRKDTNPIAHTLIETFGSYSAVFDADIEDLMQVKGMTKNAAMALHALPNGMKRYINDKNKPKRNLSSISNAVEFIKAETKFLTKERLHILCLDTHFNLINNVVIKSDSIDKVYISLKNIHSAVLRTGTKSIILAHNHPSGSILPSDDDVNLTRDVMMSMSYIEIDVLDHIIVTENNYFSFREKGLLYEILPKSEKYNNKQAAEKNNIGVINED